MDFTALFTLSNMQHLLESYRNFGPLFGILLPMIEAFLPFLPLFAFVTANAAAYGLWMGFFYSWFGSCLGSVLLFLLIRNFGQHRFFSFLNRHAHVQKAMDWIEKKGFGPIFFLFCLPFSPSALINVVSGLSNMSKKQFILALCLGKFVMIFGISYIGADLMSFVEKPMKTVVVLIVVFVLWLMGKKMESSLGVKK